MDQIFNYPKCGTINQINSTSIKYVWYICISIKNKGTVFKNLFNNSVDKIHILFVSWLFIGYENK